MADPQIRRSLYTAAGFRQLRSTNLNKFFMVPDILYLTPTPTPTASDGEPTYTYGLGRRADLHLLSGGRGPTYTYL